MRDDYALINHPSMKVRPIDVQGTASPTPVKLSLLDEFKTAAQEFVDAADAGAELDRFVIWFKALLA